MCVVCRVKVHWASSRAKSLQADKTLVLCVPCVPYTEAREEVLPEGTQQGCGKGPSHF